MLKTTRAKREMVPLNAFLKTVFCDKNDSEIVGNLMLNLKREGRKSPFHLDLVVTETHRFFYTGKGC